MTHKIVHIPKGYHYTGGNSRKIPITRSIDDIKNLLRKHGCEKIATLEEPGPEGMVCWSLAFQKTGLSYLIEFPITYLGDSKIPEMAISGRIIFYRIKNLLIEVEIDYLQFSQAMMQYIALPGPGGKPVAMQDYIEDQMPRLQHGKFELNLLPPGCDRA